MPSLDTVLNMLVTMFVIIDPIGNTPLFLGLTAGMSTYHRRSVAWRGTIVAFVILTIFASSGMAILDSMGITINAFRVAGGLLLFYTAFEMLYAKRQKRKAEVSESALKEHVANVAVFPLAIPLLAGPGAISATIILSSHLPTQANSLTGHWLGVVILIAVIGALLFLTALLLIAAESVDKYLGETGKMILTRLLGVLLAALSVQYVADGVKGLVAGAG